MDNVLNNIGDVLLVTLTPQISGRISFTGFTEDIDGETLTRSLKKEFRISTDEVFWTEWAELNNENLSSEEFLSDGSLTIQIRYTRTGTDASGSIVFNSIDFSGNIVVIKTFPGHANTVCNAIDNLNMDEVLGTVAGDNCMFACLREGVTGEEFMETLKKHIPGIED